MQVSFTPQSLMPRGDGQRAGWEKSVAVAIAVAVAVASGAAVLSGCSRDAGVAEPVRAVRTLQVQAGVSQTGLEYAAEVRPRIESRLGFRVAGKLVKRTVDLGAVVRQGQVLAELDPTDLRLGRESARAALVSAQASYEQTAADYRRYKDLREQGFISAADLERRDTALKAAQAQLDQARAQSAVQGNQARYATLTADAAGVVTSVDAEPGMVLAAGTPVVRVAQDGARDAVFSVPEDRVSQARTWLNKPGAVKVRLWGAAGADLPATVREVAGAADPVTRTFQVKADIGRADVRLGQTATVLASAGPAVASGVLVPTQAVWGQGQRSMVWVIDGSAMKVHAQPVSVIGAAGDQLVVNEGLQPGQEIVTAGVHVLTEGQAVRRWAPSAAPAAPGVSR